MAISHADHNHPNTPAARAKCRKAMASIDYVTGATPDPVVGVAVPGQMTVVPRKRGDGGVVKGMKAAAPKNTKRANSLIKNESDMGDVPHALAHGIREAWVRDLDVRVGDRFRDDEARIVIQNEVGEIALVWKVTNPHGVHAIFVRNFDSSRTFKVNSVRQAFEVTETWDAWDVHGNLVGL